MRRDPLSTRALALRALTGVVCLAIPAAAAAQDPVRGMELFQQLECSSCHGAGALGKLGPALAATSLELAAVRRQVRSPVGRKMPAFTEEELPEEDLADIYAWLQSLDPPSLSTKPTWWGSDLVNLPTPRTPDRGELEVHFSHRFSDTIQDAGREGLWGLDSFAFPGFWFTYGLTGRIAPYVGRTANLATYEYGLKVELLRESDLGVPISIGLQAGGIALDADGVANASRFTAELPVGVRAGDRLALQVVPVYTTNPDEQAFPGSEDWSMALGFGASLRLTMGLSFDGEWITNIDGYERFGARDQWQAGVTMQVGGHLFQLLVSNSVQTTPDVMAAGTLRTGIESNVRLGFNLVRGFTF